MWNLSKADMARLKLIALYILNNPNMSVFKKLTLMRVANIPNTRRGHNDFNRMICIARQLLDVDYVEGRFGVANILGTEATPDRVFQTFTQLKLTVGMPFLVGTRGGFTVPGWTQKLNSGTNNIGKSMTGIVNSLDRFKDIDQRICKPVDRQIAAKHWSAILKITGGDKPTQ